MNDTANPAATIDTQQRKRLTVSEKQTDAARVEPIVMQLSKTQAELLEAMKSGVVCHYMPYAGRFNPTDYYFRDDTMRRCTAAAKALYEKGLVEVKDKDWRGHRLVAKSA
jgi:hypothetical protein